MPTDTVNIAIDVPQPRILGDRLAKVVPAKEFDMRNSSTGVYLEAIAYTGLLRPLAATPEWLTTTSGNYARLRKSQLSIASSSAWVEYERGYSGNYYQHSLDNNDIVRTLQAYEKNRPMWLSFLNYNTGNESRLALSCGWGEGTDAEVSLEVYADGTVKIYKNGEQVGSADISKAVFYPSDLGPQDRADGASGRMLANETIDLVLIPGRRRELLCLSNTGGGFNFLFDDIDPEDPDPTVTGPGPFWFQVPTGQATVQLAPLKFKTSGYFLTGAFQLREAPGAGETHTDLYTYDLPGYGTQGLAVSLVEADGSTTFVPDGSLRTCRIRLDVTGDGDSTPFVYSLSSAFEALTAETYDGTFLLDDWWQEATLDVPEDPEGVTLNVQLFNPVGIENAGLTDLRGTGNRDIQAAIGDVSFFIGRTLDPEYEEGPENILGEFLGEMLLECRDRTSVQGQYRIQDPEPVDNFNLATAIAFFAKMPGYTDADMDIGVFDYALPSVGQASDGGFALLPEVGDTPIDWIRKLHNAYARRVYWGWVPQADGIRFRFKTPEQIGSESQATVYLTNADAVADGQASGDYKKWAYGWKPRILVPEANDITVVGRDPRTQRPIIGAYRDFRSADPTLAPPDRPSNWIGELRHFGYVDPSLTTSADVAWALGNFQDTLPHRRYIAEMRCQLLLNSDGVPLWRGDVLTVIGAKDVNGVPLDGKWRIKTLSALLDLEYADASDSAKDRIWRGTTYVVERERNQDS